MVQDTPVLLEMDNRSNTLHERKGKQSPPPHLDDLENPPPPTTTTTQEEEEIYEQEEKPQSIGCGIMGRHPVASVLIAAFLGLLVGLLLSEWEPQDKQVKQEVVKWAGLGGDLFLRALKCIVLPLVFLDIVQSTVEMLGMGKAQAVGGWTMGIFFSFFFLFFFFFFSFSFSFSFSLTPFIGLYLFTTLMASVVGVISVLIFSHFFVVMDPIDIPPPSFDAEIMCPTGNREEKRWGEREEREKN